MQFTHSNCSFVCYKCDSKFINKKYLDLHINNCRSTLELLPTENSYYTHILPKDIILIIFRYLYWEYKNTFKMAILASIINLYEPWIYTNDLVNDLKDDDIKRYGCIGTRVYRYKDSQKKEYLVIDNNGGWKIKIKKIKSFIFSSSNCKMEKVRTLVIVANIKNAWKVYSDMPEGDLYYS